MMKRGAYLFVVAVFCSVYVAPAAVLAADCFSNPTQPACASFQLNSTAVTSDLQQLCMPNGTMNSVGWPSACALFEQCNAGNASSTYCAPFTLLRTACQEASNSYCTPYESLCSSGSLVPACSSQLPVPLVPSAMSAANATATMCKSMPDMPGCSTCSMASPPNGTGPVQTMEVQCPNPLLSLSQACLDVYMTGCDLWNNFCKATSNNAGFPFLCKGTSSPGSVSPPSSGMNMNMNMNMTPSGSPSPSSTSPLISLAPSPETTSPCFADPTKSSCQNFTLSDAIVNSYLASLCAAMPNMVGCTFWNECKNDGTTTSWCSPFSLYATICTEMPSMKDCKPYSELCEVTGTAVLQCSISSPIPGAPTTSQATQEVLQMCSEMSMSGCENCTSTSECPDPMGTLSEVCLGMSGMAGCSSFYSMCTMIETTFTSLCGYESSSEYLPPMKMWLHASITDILLIKQWVPRNGGQYAASCLAVIAAAILVQAFKAMRVSLEAQWALKSRNQPASCCPPGSACNQPRQGKASLSEQGLAGPSYSDSSGVGRNGTGCRNTLTSMFSFGLPAREQMGRNAIRAGFTAIVVFLDYMLMLIVMSFNIGIILSAVAGFTIGAFLFGHSGEMIRGASVLSVGEIAPDSENDLEVHFVDPQTCCNSRMV